MAGTSPIAHTEGMEEQRVAGGVATRAARRRTSVLGSVAAARRGRSSGGVLKKVLLSLMVVGAMGTTVGAGTFASYTGRATNASNTFSTGTIALGNQKDSGRICISTNGGDLTGSSYTTGMSPSQISGGTPASSQTDTNAVDNGANVVANVEIPIENSTANAVVEAPQPTAAEPKAEPKPAPVKPAPAKPAPKPAPTTAKPAPKPAPEPAAPATPACLPEHHAMGHC